MLADGQSAVVAGSSCRSRADLDEAGHPKCNANVKEAEVVAVVKEANVVVVTSGARRCFSG